jgi:Subtilase family
MQGHTTEIHKKEIFFTRIVIKFYDHSQINYTLNNILETLSRKDSTGQWKTFIQSCAGIQIDKLFTSISTDSLLELVNRAKTLDTKYTPPNLLTYYVLSCPASVSSHEVLLKLTAFKEVELAYLQSAAIAPGINNIAPPVARKEFTEPSPLGINAKYAWGIQGGRGSPQIKFIDIEQGWILDHEAITAHALPLTGINHPRFRDHGAGVLGIIMMQGPYGCGITPDVSGYVISQWRPGGEPNDADAVIAALTYLNFGDILLLETQSFFSIRNNKIWPAEVQEATFQAIRLATALGIIVIEAAGNGDLTSTAGNDLDFFTINKKRIFNPAGKDFRDSGAIIVAAASWNVPHKRITYSNYGKRINCYAWGEAVATAGNYPHSPGGSINSYTTHFAGTSSASAIIAGVAIAVQSITEIKHSIRLNPVQMRYILSSDQYGTASANGLRVDKIGVMPDLKKIIDLCLSVAPPVV